MKKVAEGGNGDMQVAEPAKQHRVMIEAVENHMPEVIIVDEIGTEAEALACRTIAERGVMLIGTAHGQLLENLIKNPSLSDLVGGVHTVTLGDDEARLRGTSKSVMERKAPPTFPVLLELRERQHWVTHRVEESVDATLQGKRPHVQVSHAAFSLKRMPGPCVRQAVDLVDPHALTPLSPRRITHPSTHLTLSRLESEGRANVSLLT
jgi:hypothetical protein